MNMLIPHLHFCGDCTDAIALYEKAFNTKVDYPPEYSDNIIAHASIKIHGQTIYLNDNDMFSSKRKTPDCAQHLVVTFESVEELLACYEFFKEDAVVVHQFTAESYSKLSGNFLDKFGVLWGFMVI